MRPTMDHHTRIRPILTLIVSLTVWILSACTPAPSPTATPPPTPTATPAPPTPTAAPTPVTQELALCTREPATASPFYPSQAGSDLLALFYEAPIERVGYAWVPRLVTEVPSLANGGVSTELRTVQVGNRYVDLTGQVRIHEGEEPRERPAMVVTFTLKSDLRWSDGTPITAEDSVLGYHLAQSEVARGRWRALAERTARYTALDERTLRWEGLPGYLDQDFPGFFFPLQPAHRWKGKTLQEIFEDRTPPASGPFKIVAWESGRQVRLEPNPHYSGTAPTLSALTVHFPQTAPSQWTGLVRAGACDVVLPDPAVITEWEPWADLGRAGEAVIWADTAPSVLRLDFNLDPASGPPSAVADPVVRQAIGHCIDRRELTVALPTEALTVAETLAPPDHPAYPLVAAGGSMPAFDRQRGRDLLTERGWEDRDRDGVREAEGVPEITDGTPLSLTLHFPTQSFVIAAHIAEDLKGCGLGVALAPTDVRQLFAASAESPLFNRTFEMALLGWQAEVPRICGSWLSDRIPTESGGWIGENFSGYSAEAYDQACVRALGTLNPRDQAMALQQAQQALAEDLPSLLLAWRPFWFVARPEVKGIRPDASAYGTLWNSEALYKATEME